MKKRSLKIAGHATSISLEEPFWEELKKLARERGQPLNALIAEIDGRRGDANLSSALRVYVLESLRARPVTAPAGSPAKRR